MAKCKLALTLTIFTLISTLSLFFAAKPAHAGLLEAIKEAFGQSASDAQSEKNELLKSVADEEASNGKLTQQLGGNLLVVTNCYVTGCGDSGSVEAAGLTESERQIVQKKFGGGGAIGGMGKAIAMMYNPPASAQTYVADLFYNAKIVPQAYAQGLGFAALDPVLETWKVFRNISYLFFVLIFLVIGFMIMFRHKISGQTVVTAQQAIPQIIIALIFVTFSYAIAGLLIDIMYLSMYLMIGVFGGDVDLINKNFLQLGASLVLPWEEGSAFGSVNNAVESFVHETTSSLGVLGDILSWVSGITVGVIVSIAILIGVFKLFFELLKTYIAVIISIAFAPIVLMMGALPGKNVFVGWLKSLVGNLAAWPAVLLLLIMYKTITENEIASGGFMPPYMIGQGTGGAVTTLVGIGIILAIPETIKKIKEAFGAKEGVIGELLNTAVQNAKRGIAPTKKIAGYTAATGGGMLGGALVGGYLGKTGKIGDQAGGWRQALKYGAIGAPIGAAAPVVIPPLYKGAHKLSALGQTIQNWGYVGTALGPAAQGVIQKAADKLGRTPAQPAGTPPPPPAAATTTGTSGVSEGSAQAKGDTSGYA
ncbi:MAG: hypothetical protein PVJ09_04300 [Candidatus Woesebacteria bacterium]|jgi:hypothetical protein